ncbi:unnamed protein product [Brachionus calyciflorus]|uniref:Uncharacterized protein n=1 Tax=Brachionus calyciflorus TaxID=104777 RepID=A0A813M0F3_9BILA|nr:unnamed protein product [Brachionus calyciflorus]
MSMPNKIPIASSMDYLYQAISLIEAKNYPNQPFQAQSMSTPTTMGDYTSNLINENKKRMIGNLIYQNQQHQPFHTQQPILSNNENFNNLVNLANYTRINPQQYQALQKQPISTSCTCCHLNQYNNQYLYPNSHKNIKIQKTREDKRINTLINNRQMQLKETEKNTPPSRLEKAKQLARKIEQSSSTSTSPMYSSNSNSPVTDQFQNQYYPVDVLYTLLPMYLNPVLNKQNFNQQPQVDPAYIQSLVSYYLNFHHQQQQQQQLKHQHNYKSFSSVSTASTNSSASTTLKRQANKVQKNTNIDVDSKVDEHFKRSLGNEYLNLMSNAKRMKLDESSKTPKIIDNPVSPSSSVQTISSCSSPALNINEASNESDKSEHLKLGPDYVDSHFSKALGVDMWNKLKEKIKIEIDNNSDMSSTVSTMSEASLSPVKL